jgi:hypothetical protein
MAVSADAERGLPFFKNSMSCSIFFFYCLNNHVDVAAEDNPDGEWEN